MPKAKNRPISLIHVSDIHFGSGESHGRINPETGLNIRFEDFVQALTKTVDYAIEQDVDVFLFSGDAYRNASPDPIYQKMFARQLHRLSQAGIRSVLVVGNHDQILKSTASHSMSVFQSLAVPHMLTVDQPTVTKIETRAGALQLIGLPHVTRNFLMTNPDYASLPPAEIDRVLANHVRELLKGMYDELDPKLPAVATAHMMMDQARAGAEQELMVGYSMTFPLDVFVDDRLDYVALGHVHRHQILRSENPAIVYAGSIERVDFGEEAEDKGFVHVQISRGNCQYAFHSINPRPFITVDADVREAEDPTATLAALVEKKRIPGSVMRIRYKIRQEQLPSLDERALRSAAGDALTVHLKPELIVKQREARMPDITEALVSTPMRALESYLTQMAPERKEQLLNKARELCQRLEESD